MSYFVFARKYRPQKFSEVAAQRHITETLTKAIEHGRITQAYLFCGVRGTGKTSVARILAKRLNCQNPYAAEPCDQCDSCLGIIQGRSLDILEIDAASNTSVDDVRELRESIKYAPVGGKYKVYIIDEVHRLSPSAFDALLKTLEEPPTHAVFIFATTEVHKVPQTILSRCQRYDFRRISEAEIKKALEEIAQKEKLQISKEALDELARRGDGSLRDSLSLLDQVASWQRELIDMPLLSEALGILPRSAYREIIKLVNEKKPAAIISRVSEVFDSGITSSEFVRGMEEEVRRMLLLKAAPEVAEEYGISADDVAATQGMVSRYSLNDLLRIQNLLVNLEQKIRDGFDPRINIELALLKLMNMESSVSVEELLHKLSSIDKASPLPAQATLFSDKKKVSSPLPAPIATRDASHHSPEQISSSTDNLEVIWRQLLQELCATHRNLQIKLTLARPQGLEKDILTVAFDRNGEFHVRQLQEREVQVTLQEVAKKVTGRTLKFHFFVDKELPQNSTAGINNHLFTESDKQRHPLVTRALEVFDATVVGRDTLPGE